MLRGNARPVVDLMPARGARRRDAGLWPGAADRREQRQLADSHRDLVAVLGETEGAGHATAAAVEDLEPVARDSPEHPGAGVGAPQGLLMAVGVEDDRALWRVERGVRGVLIAEAVEEVRGEERLGRRLAA